jgi:hypothetical protein
MPMPLLLLLLLLQTTTGSNEPILIIIIIPLERPDPPQDANALMSFTTKNELFEKKKLSF